MSCPHCLNPVTRAECALNIDSGQFVKHVGDAATPGCGKQIPPGRIIFESPVPLPHSLSSGRAERTEQFLSSHLPPTPSGTSAAGLPDLVAPSWPSAVPSDDRLSEPIVHAVAPPPLAAKGDAMDTTPTSAPPTPMLIDAPANAAAHAADPAVSQPVSTSAIVPASEAGSDVAAPTHHKGEASGAVLVQCPHLKGIPPAMLSAVFTPPPRHCTGAAAASSAPSLPSDCSPAEGLWLCLVCGHVGCPQAVNRHARAHYEATRHALAYDTKSHTTFCYTCDVHVAKDRIALIRLIDTPTPPSVVAPVVLPAIPSSALNRLSSPRATPAPSDVPAAPPRVTTPPPAVPPAPLDTKLCALCNRHVRAEYEDTHRRVMHTYKAGMQPEATPTNGARHSGSALNAGSAHSTSSVYGTSAATKRGSHPYASAKNFSTQYGPDLAGGAKRVPVMQSTSPLSFSDKTPSLLGEWRGIQAENNSCYLDSTLFALFAHMQSADFLLDTARPGLSPSAQRLRELLWTTVVGPLRKRAFVSRYAMEAVRITLNEWLPGNDLQQPGACRERDVEELLSAVFGALRIEPLVRLLMREPNGSMTPSDTHILQLLYDERQGKRMRVSELLKASMGFQSLKFAEMPKLLLIQVPRYGKERVLDLIWPDDLIDLAPHLHTPKPADSVSEMRLRAILSIGVSHFVTFFAGSDRQWYFFDSMADRIGDECVPCVAEVSEVQTLLRGQPFATIPRPRTMAHRLLSDCYMCVYTPKRKKAK